MDMIPNTENALVLRTDFSNQDDWEKICKIIQAPSEDFGFLANVDFVDDRKFEDISGERLLKLIPPDYVHSFLIVVDHKAISENEHPLLVIDLSEPGREFRAIPTQIQGIENNLTIANMGFEDFAGAVDSDGVFRGFAT